uniref:Uncharacterized protein n=1 Tax=Kuenenia stuttgartiensis TaxID=174633 RepID=Q1Q366_KUEST|nr:unknown protein [Candidatus Kuenenia stuttgartiensis]
MVVFSINSNIFLFSKIFSRRNKQKIHLETHNSPKYYPIVCRVLNRACFRIRFHLPPPL